MSESQSVERPHETIPGEQPPGLAEAFKDAFRHHPAGVALVTAQTPTGPVGLTATSVASVSADPAALSFSLASRRNSAAGIVAAETYVVHLLDAPQRGLAETFARSGTERFTADQGWTLLPTGEPHHPAARVALRCRRLHQVEVGESTLVLAQVLEVLPGPSGRPFLYVDREFREVGAVLADDVVPADEPR